MNKFSMRDYCQYLISSQINYTLTNFADHVPGLSHDRANRYLKNVKLAPGLLYEHVRDDVVESADGYLLFDDTVSDKNYSQKIEGVRRQYSGNAHGIIKGIGVVTCVYVNPETRKFWIIDYRVFDPDRDGKTKIDHVGEMLDHAEQEKKIPFGTVLMDSWYATHKLILKIDDMGKTYYCPLKANRLVDDSPGDGAERSSYKRIDELSWNERELERGKTIRVNKFPKRYRVKLFRVAVSTNRTEHVATNAADQESAGDVRDECAIRWKIEEFHREAKQLTGLEKCQCRTGRIQRNHIACAMLVWACMKRVANDAGKTIYKVKHDLLKDYLTRELRSPRVVFA